MMKKTFLILAIFLGHTLAAQVLKNSAGQTTDMTFDSCDYTIGLAGVNPYPHVDCANWDYIFTEPSTTKELASGGLIYEPRLSKVFCLMTTRITDGQTTHNEGLKAYATGLVPGNRYVFSFYQVYVNSMILNTDFSRAAFEVYIGDESFTSEEMVYPNTPPSASWSAIQTFAFCATATEELITIKPIMFNPDDTHTNQCTLGLDTANIQLEEVAYCSTNPEPPCIDCTSFELIKKQKYVISGWVKLNNEQGNYRAVNYDHVKIKVEFEDEDDVPIPEGQLMFGTSGEIIDGWQKISGTFGVPGNADDMSISLDNTTEFTAYFDDIRVHPYNGNLKSFVYDQATHKLMAELDENNYASFYEYDKEGGLVRVKKETEKGVFSIQETRSSNRKK